MTERYGFEIPQPRSDAESDEDRRCWLVRELHDTVCADLTDLLIEMELVRCHDDSVELHRFISALRDLLVSVRQLLWELRDQSPPDEHILQVAIERKVTTALWHHAQAARAKM